jgi:O-antigen ligase
VTAPPAALPRAAAARTPRRTAVPRRFAAPLRAVPWPSVPAVATVLLLCLPGDPARAATGGPGPADAASAVLVLCCAVALLRGGRRPLAPAAALWLAVPALALGLAAACTPDTAAGVRGLVRHLQIFVLVPGALLLLLRTRRHFRVVAASFVLLALVQGAVGVHQYLTGTGASYRGQDVRAVGTFGPQDVMGMSTVVAYGLLVALAVGLAPAHGRSGRRIRTAALCCAAALSVPLVLSFSRGAWIATAAAALAVLLLSGTRRAVRVLAVAVAACVVLAVGAGGQGRLLGERLGSIGRVTDAPDRSVTDRYALWTAAAGMWRAAPVTGVGLKQFAAHRDSHAPLGLSSASDTAGAGLAFHREPLLSPHNMYLLLLAETGLVGLTALAGGWAALLAAGAAALRPRGGVPAAEAPAVPGADCGLVAAGLLVWTCVDFLYADTGGPTTVLTALALGLGGWWAFSPAARTARTGPR